MESLAKKRCQVCEGGVDPLSPAEIEIRLKQLKDWRIDNGFLTKEFRFANYHETMAFVNATAWISHREDHHPDLDVHYNRCGVRYITHAINGLSDNDFICAAKIDELF